MTADLIFSMSAQDKGTRRLADERFARFKARRDIRRVTAQYADWAESPDGSIVNVQLAGLAVARLSGRISRQAYRSSLRKMSRESGLPQHDFRLLAECGRELARCALAGTGQVPFAPSQWDAEEAEFLS